MKDSITDTHTPGEEEKPDEQKFGVAPQSQMVPI